jgi:hypothetical protein
MRQRQCDGCGQMKLVNACTLCDAFLGEFCADCFERIDHDKPGGKRAYSGSGPNHNDPGFDNVIRALEEDR